LGQEIFIKKIQNFKALGAKKIFFSKMILIIFNGFLNYKN